MARFPTFLFLALAFLGCRAEKVNEKRDAEPVTEIPRGQDVAFQVWDFGLLIPRAIHWQFRSLEQYHALQPFVGEPDHGIFAIDYDLTVDRSNPAHLVITDGFLPDSLPGIAGFFYTHLPPEYVCDVALVWSIESGESSIDFTSRLKNIEEIVLFDNPQEQVVARWREQFPNAKIFTANELGFEHPKDGGVF